MKFPEKLTAKIEIRKQNNAFRELPLANNLIDFASNDYLGFSKSAIIFEETHNYLVQNKIIQNGATGSRLISGNHITYTKTETVIANFHQSQTALLFNSGYDANIGFFSAVPQKGDFILYDELSHASIRDGIIMSKAKAYKFQHNDFRDLERLILKLNPLIQNNTAQNETQLQNTTTIYIVTESVFSMDGDTPNLEELTAISEKHNCFLVLDEAHALGVFGANGQGLVEELQLQNKIFARIITFGKGLGCHGAAILGSQYLKDYLINFSRSFIYTTGLSPHSVATILIAYKHLQKNQTAIEQLKSNILYFNNQKTLLSLKPLFIRSKSAIQSAVIPGNNQVKKIAQQMQQNGFNVKAILSPTVPEGQERLRFCLHSYNTKDEIKEVLHLLNGFLI